MIDAVYKTLNGLGYTHPLHPTLTRIVMGLVIGGFVFAWGVWGRGAPTVAMAGNQAEQGAVLFEQNCSACHYPDRRETKIGPGLKGILAGDRLPASGRPATVESVRDQLKTPYKTMPSFAYLSEGEVAALIAFLKTL
jgi:mono/diheme cytochrome c family protein